MLFPYLYIALVTCTRMAQALVNVERIQADIQTADTGQSKTNFTVT